jgi:hypothetical protein
MDRWPFWWSFYREQWRSFRRYRYKHGYVSPLPAFLTGGFFLLITYKQLKLTD